MSAPETFTLPLSASLLSGTITYAHAMGVLIRPRFVIEGPPTLRKRLRRVVAIARFSIGLLFWRAAWRSVLRPHAGPCTATRCDRLVVRAGTREFSIPHRFWAALWQSKALDRWRRAA